MTPCSSVYPHASSPKLLKLTAIKLGIRGSGLQDVSEFQLDHTNTYFATLKCLNVCL
jgi:hypothetical protein